MRSNSYELSEVYDNKCFCLDYDRLDDTLKYSGNYMLMLCVDNEICLE